MEKLSCSKALQLSVYLDNRKGTLAKLARFLGDHGVNLYGLTLGDGEGHGYARLVVDDAEKARQLVEDAGELVGVREVLAVRLENRPGQLARVLEALAACDVNVEYGYSTGGPGDEKGLVLVTADADAALAALAGFDAAG
jgi:hypothetical protein